MPLFVRINAMSTDLAAADLAAVVGAQPYGIVLPKCASGQDVRVLDATMLAIEARDGVDPGSLRILPIVTESAASLFGMGSYANEAGARLCGMFWGGEDLAADIGARANRTPDGRYTAPYQLARALTLMGATAARVPAIDAVYTNFRDREGLKAEAMNALRDGFTAKVAIHPDQIGPINDIFTPSSADLDAARQIIAAFDASPGTGAIAIDGKMFDRPHYRSAQRLLGQAKNLPSP
jgi:citrate lyase subunit beta/citryl-CoA lyase